MNNHTRYPLVAGALAEVLEVAVAALVVALVAVAALVVVEILVAVYLPEISVRLFRRLRRRHMQLSQRLWQ